MSLDFKLQPILENETVLIRPLVKEDFESLYQVAADPGMWEQHPAKERSQREGFAKFFDDAIQSKSAFLIINKIDNEVMGTSRYNLVREAPDAIEIGWTFIAKKFWGGHYNGAIKKLMIDYAFTNIENILFYIHHENMRSQKAVEKIGGKRIESYKGITLPIRPTASVVYCINKNDWMSSLQNTVL